MKKKRSFRYFVIVGLIALSSFGLSVFSFSQFLLYDSAVIRGPATYESHNYNELRMRLWSMVLILSSVIFFASLIIVYYFVKKRSKISNE